MSPDSARASTDGRSRDDLVPSADGGPGAPGQPALDHVQSLLLNVQSMDAVLTDLAGLATAVVGPTSCGITVRYDGQLLTVGSSDPLAETLDETQYRAGEGPCLEALDTARIVDVADVARETRWPSYLPTARDAGLRCSLSLPLFNDPPTTGNTAFGAMNVYGFDRPQMFGETERRQLELFAARAAGTLQVARRLTRDSALLGQMDEALNSRTVIDQALGIIMGQQRCTASDAFEILRRQSQNSRQRLRDIAADLVQHATGHPSEPGRTFTGH